MHSFHVRVRRKVTLCHVLNGRSSLIHSQTLAMIEAITGKHPWERIAFLYQSFLCREAVLGI